MEEEKEEGTWGCHHRQQPRRHRNRSLEREEMGGMGLMELPRRLALLLLQVDWGGKEVELGGWENEPGGGVRRRQIQRRTRAILTTQQQPCQVTNTRALFPAASLAPRLLQLRLPVAVLRLIVVVVTVVLLTPRQLQLALLLLVVRRAAVIRVLARRQQQQAVVVVVRVAGV